MLTAGFIVTEYASEQVSSDYAHTRVMQVQFLLVLCCLQCRPIKVSPEVRDKR